MPQTIVTLTAEIDPDRLDVARELIEKLRIKIEGNSKVTGSTEDSLFKPLVTSLPGLHFASIMIFEDEQFDPLLTLELNFDGPTCKFLPSLQTETLTPFLRAVLRCCKPPEDAAAAKKYRLATGDGAMAPYLETLIVKPAVFHQGNRGLERERIIAEAALFESVQTRLDAPTFARPADAVALHKELRGQLLPANGWLGEPAASRLPQLERAKDIGKLAGLILGVVLALLAPGLLLWWLLPPLGTALSLAALLLLAYEFLRLRARPREVAPPRPAYARQLPPQERPLDWKTLVAGLVLLVLAIGVFVPVVGGPAGGVVLIVVGVLHALRRLETTDRVQLKPKIDPGRLREIMELEDQTNQNHMGSVVHVKPGILRAILIRLGLWGLGLYLRVTATNGYLANMRTIHFAHWALLDNGSRLIFFSNFDSSWESYLDDFIEKAHEGLTLAWSNGVGFPRTRMLMQDGATRGPLFKAWARRSMARGLFWVSAYPKLSVNQIERNCAIAAGLRAPSLSPRDAEAWAALL